jgi:HSP20 family protein
MNMPAVNVKETDKAFVLEVAVPGMKKDDFKLEMKDGMLIISAETEIEKEEKDENYTRKEFNYSSFSRSFWLPENVKTDDIKANYKEGMLLVTLPKEKIKLVEKAKMIEVK